MQTVPSGFPHRILVWSVEFKASVLRLPSAASPVGCAEGEGEERRGG